MRRLLIVLFAFIVLQSARVHAQIILEAKPEDLPALAASYQLTIDKGIESRPIYVVRVPSTTTAATMVGLLSSDSKVAAVETELEAGVTERQTGSKAAGTSDSLNDAMTNLAPVTYYGSTVPAAYVEQPAAKLVRVAEAQQQSGGGNDIVAIIDTGADPTHDALLQVLVPGYDFTRESAYVSELLDLDPLTSAALTQSTVAFLDGYPAKLNQSTVAFLDQSTVAFLDTNVPQAFGHGTMVAGLVHLVAPSAKIMPLKAFRADGTAKLSDIVRAIYYAVDHGAKVINMSFSVSASSPELTKAINFAASQNVICVASAGNMGKNVKLYPAGNKNVIGVGSTNKLDVRSSFSNYDVSSARTAAPGEAAVTTYPGNHYAGVWGTSFSTALVSGGVALMLDARPSAHYGDIADALDHGYKIEQKMGDARLDLVRSIQYLMHK